ncbi:YXWGXW repeat-containing protein [Gluconobacter kanchanaburiensis]|uniref:Uncharacterized protein n=1 Tax=Gluconobacter kanchanaburiensis NBRC 103587 TaxID=1307948 RepID=A0A511B3E3_9PROT|nr:YXWGXW repeat-containing protein [Gluconobacter kanchanaburiensis]MBF0860870.1 BcpO-related WXXGXW repeat protein [Gluconobacter kanchanaburiensis]GBR69950.1 hypothetical protein AA103587_1606 [Gluconobacter kanchanaburiensis NBRC 103587]GEK94954.1 hypothetical protein GKA01_01510 [Gluconobacter kanchanaburiensis NBRC 103587]
MLKHLSGILAVSALFAGTMAIAPMSGTAHAQFVPYSGPYRQAPPPPHTLPETIPPHRGDLHWVPGYWRWSGNGYRWQPGHLSRKPNLRHA